MDELDEPGVNQNVVERLREYEQRKDGRYVKGRVASINDTELGSEIVLEVDLPNETFTHHFAEPSPNEHGLERVAKEYGTGLIDIADLKGETVWCEKQNGQWQIVIRRGRIREAISRGVRWLSDTDSKNLVVVSILAPIIALSIKDQQEKANRWSHREMPSDLDIGWANGVLYTWLGIFIYLFIDLGLIALI